MADITNLGNFLVDVAEAIRTKKGTTDKIPAENFDIEIESIATGTVVEKVEVEASEIVEEETAVKVVSTPITEPVVIPENGVAEVITDKTVLAESIGLTPSKIVKGETVLNVEGTAEGGGVSTDVPVKLFETIDEMQADTDANEGDLALVYRSEIQNASIDSRFSKATFPATVVLPKAMKDYVEIMYRAADDNVMFDCWGQLDNSSFYMDCYTDEGSIRIQYKSTDGITYTRTDSGEETIDFGTEIYYYYEDYWNDAIGYFIQTGGMYFEGLYNYVLNNPLLSYRLRALDINKFDLTKKASNVNIITSGIYTGEDMFTGVEIGAKFKQIVDSLVHIVQCAFTEDLSKLYVFDPSTQSIYIINDKFYIYAASGDSVLYAYDMKTLEKTTINATKENITLPDGTSKSFYSFPEDAKWFTGSFVNNNAYLYYYIDNIQQSVSWVNGVIPEVDSKNAYMTAPTQLTLQDVNELLPGKTAYGKTGMIEGDGSIYGILDDNTIVDSLVDADNLKIVYGKEAILERSIKSIVNVSEEDMEFIAIGTEFMAKEDMEARLTEIRNAWGVTSGASNFQPFTIYKDRLYFQLNNGTNYNFGYTTDNFKTYTKLSGTVQGSNSGLNDSQHYYFKKSPIVNGKILVARYNPYGNPTDHTLFSIDLDNNKVTSFTMPTPNNVLRFVICMTIIGDDILVLASGSSQYKTAIPVLVRYNTLTDTITDKSGILPQLYDMSIGNSLQKDGIWYSIITGTYASADVRIKLLITNGQNMSILDIASASKHFGGTNVNGYNLNKIGDNYYAWHTCGMPVYKLDFTTPSNSVELTFNPGEFSDYTSYCHLYNIVKTTDTKLYAYENKTIYCVDIEKQTISHRQMKEVPIPNTSYTNEWIHVSGNHYRTLMLNTYTSDNSLTTDNYRMIDIYLDTSLTDFTPNCKNLVITINENTGKNIRLLNDIVDTDYTGTVSPVEYDTAVDTAREILGEEV